VFIIWHSEDRASWYILMTKANEVHYFSTLFGKELCVFRTDLQSIIRSLNTVFTALGIWSHGKWRIECVMDQLIYGIMFIYVLFWKSCLCWWYDWIYSCSYGNNSEVLLICFNKFMVLLMGPYTCLLFRMCST